MWHSQTNKLYSLHNISYVGKALFFLCRFLIPSDLAGPLNGRKNKKTTLRPLRLCGEYSFVSLCPLRFPLSSFRSAPCPLRFSLSALLSALSAYGTYIVSNDLNRIFSSGYFPERAFLRLKGIFCCLPLTMRMILIFSVSAHSSKPPA